MTKQIKQIVEQVRTEANSHKWDNRRATEALVDALVSADIELVSEMPKRHDGSDNEAEYERLEKAEAYRLMFP